jgi:transcriptional regulator with XRE-family HTH domain
MNATDVPSVAAFDGLYTSGVHEEQFRRRLASLLVAVIRERRIEQKDLAAEVGVTSATMSRWLTAKHAPKSYELHRIAEALGLSGDDLLFPSPTQTESLSTRAKKSGPIPEDEAAIADAEAAMRRERAAQPPQELRPESSR